MLLLREKAATATSSYTSVRAFARGLLSTVSKVDVRQSPLLESRRHIKSAKGSKMLLLREKARRLWKSIKHMQVDGRGVEAVLQCMQDSGD